MKTFQIIAIFIVLCYSSLTGQNSDPVKYVSLSPHEFHLKYLEEEKSILIDVRENFEFKRTRIKGAINIPSSGNLDFSTDTLDKDCALFLYCTTGYRSNRVSRILCEKGFSHVYSLNGGIVGWKKEGRPVVRKKIKDKRKKTKDKAQGSGENGIR